MKHLEEIKTLSPATLRMLLCNYALAVKHQRDIKGTPLWSVVGKLCCVGSTSAHDLCRIAGLEPGQPVSPRLDGWASFQNLAA